MLIFLMNGLSRMNARIARFANWAKHRPDRHCEGAVEIAASGGCCKKGLRDSGAAEQGRGQVP